MRDVNGTVNRPSPRPPMKIRRFCGGVGDGVVGVCSNATSFAA